MPTIGRHRVAVLALPGVLALDLGIPVQAFGNDPRYQVTVCADPAAGLVRSGGFTVTADAGLEALAEAHTVVIPGYADCAAAPPPPTTGRGHWWPRRAATAARRSSSPSAFPPANGDDLAAVRAWMLAHLGQITGLGSPAALRATFHRHLGTSPQKYRALFTHDPVPVAHGTERIRRTVAEPSATTTATHRYRRCNRRGRSRPARLRLPSRHGMKRPGQGVPMTRGTRPVSRIQSATSR